MVSADLDYKSSNIANGQANVFLASAAMQVFTCKRVIEDYFSANIYSNYLFVMSPVQYELTIEAKRCHVIFLTPKRGLSKIRELLWLKKELTSIRMNYGCVSVFIAHPYQWLANYLLLSYSHNAAYLIQEGILNYCRYDVNKFQQQVMKKYSAFNWIMGFPYRPYQGLLTMADRFGVYEGIFVFSKEGLVCSPKDVFEISTVPLADVSRSSEAYRCLFLDQDLEEFMEPGDVRLIRNLSVQYLAEKMGYKEILYKSHPFQRNLNGILDELMLRGVKVNTIDTPKPVELIVQDLQLREVVGYFSSALVNIKNCIPNIACTSIGFDITAKYRDLELVREYFRRHEIAFK